MALLLANYYIIVGKLDHCLLFCSGRLTFQDRHGVRVSLHSASICALVPAAFEFTHLLD